MILPSFLHRLSEARQEPYHFRVTLVLGHIDILGNVLLIFANL